MLVVLKFLHFISFSVAIGGGIANMIVGIRASRLEPQAAVPLRLAQGAIGKASTLSLIVLWITGLWMWATVYAGQAALGTAFHVKMAAVLVLTAISINLNVSVMRALKANKPPSVQLVKISGMGMAAMALVAVFAALMEFT